MQDSQISFKVSSATKLTCQSSMEHDHVWTINAPCRKGHHSNQSQTTLRLAKPRLGLAFWTVMLDWHWLRKLGSFPSHTELFFCRNRTCKP